MSELDRTRVDGADGGDSLPHATQPVEVRTDHVRVDEQLPDVGIAEAHRRFGGLDLPASLVGMLTALALTILLAGLIGAALGAIGYQTGLKHNADKLSAAGLAGGIIVLFLSFVLGGWAAARIARYDGPLNGIATAVWAIVLAAILAGLAAWLGSAYNVFSHVGLPHFFSRNALTTAAILSSIGAALAMLIGGLLGGLWGERFHRRADAAIASTRPGGIFVRERQVIER
jgi:MFS family permease